ncbi:MAG TPA: acetylxylan esterase, partial [Bacteroidales bacterium]|nr:acetylxylan esterase [Bacteroidales bacterium]
LSCAGASPVYKLLTGETFPADDMPPLNSPVMSRIGYHIRTGGHAVTLYDWQQYLRFADMHLQKKERATF